MVHYRTPLSFCAFCNKPLGKLDTKYHERVGVGILCNKCERDITRNLGEGWYNNDWWKDFKENYKREQNTTFRNRDWSLESLKEQESSGYVKNIPVAQIDGTRIEVPVGTLRSIIKRLHETYGYGYKRITRILREGYKISIGVEGVRYHLTALRKDENLVLTVREDAKFWRDWHDELNRMEKERGKELRTNESLQEGPTDEPS